MNRTIKFRGKRTDNGEWVYGDLFKSHSEHHSPSTSIATDEFHPVGYGSKTWYEVIPETVGQFTGLHDKDGKEIYEGDIVKHTLKFDDDVYDSNTNRVRVSYVFWQEFRSVFAVQINGHANNDLYVYCRNGGDAQVIGNIHDNPQLLNQQQ